MWVTYLCRLTMLLSRRLRWTGTALRAATPFGRVGETGTARGGTRYVN